MSTWGDDATRPAGATQGGVPTGDETVPVTRAGGGYGGPGGPGDGGWDEGGDGWDEEPNNRKWWWIVGGVLLAGLLIGALIAILASGDDDTASDTTTTTTSSTTTTSTTTTTTTTTTTLPPTTVAPTTAPTTTQAPGPQITQFVNDSGTPDCPTATEITLKWSTSNTSDVTISIDNPNGPYGNYPSSSQATVPFACGGADDATHTYYLTANGTNGQKAQQSITVQSS